MRKILEDFYVQDSRHHFIDGTPVVDYPLRILQHYRSLCNSLCSSISDEIREGSPLIKLMNDTQRKRAKLLDKAIEILMKEGR